jgi:hypothetical protein
MGEKETATEDAVVKTKTKSNQSNDRTAATGDWTDDNTDDDESPEARINNTKSNIKNREAGSTDSPEAGRAADEGDRAAKPRVAVLEFREAAGGAGSRGDIAIGDPGVNDNIAGLAVSDEGVPADKPKSK